jgi:branched-chain amino acid transport system permease protein
MADETAAAPPPDREQIALAMWDKRMRAALRPLITKKIITEHRRDPLGHHSDALNRVLNYIRRRAPWGKCVVICTKPFKQWRVARLPGARGQVPVFIDERTYNSEAKAMHAAFLVRIEELMRD